MGPIQHALSRRKDEDAGRRKEFDFILSSFRRSISQVRLFIVDIFVVVVVVVAEVVIVVEMV